MSTTKPIRSEEDLRRIKEYYQKREPNPRNDLLIHLCLYSALRISDILSLRGEDVYDFEQGRIREHLSLTEQKTGKESRIYISQSLREALMRCIDFGRFTPGHWLLPSRKFPWEPISRFQAYRIVRNAAEALGMEEIVSPHSLRKTFGYHAWKQGISPVLLMSIYNHSSFQITKRYLGIEQDDRDEVFRNIRL